MHHLPVKSFAIAATQFMLVLGLAGSAMGNNRPVQTDRIVSASEPICIAHGPSMPPDPWDARTLEWSISSPPCARTISRTM